MEMRPCGDGDIYAATAAVDAVRQVHDVVREMRGGMTMQFGVQSRVHICWNSAALRNFGMANRGVLTAALNARRDAERRNVPAGASGVSDKLFVFYAASPT